MLERIKNAQLSKMTIISLSMLATGLLLIGFTFFQDAVGSKSIGPCARAAHAAEAAGECQPDIVNFKQKNVTILSGAVNFDSSALMLTPEGCLDDILDKVVGATPGSILILGLKEAGCTPLKKITINNNPAISGGFSLNSSASFSLDSIYDSIMLMKRVGSDFWVEVSRTDDKDGGVVTNQGARVYNSANISIPNATTTVLTFNTERYDTNNLHSTSSNTSRITFQSAGKYELSAVVRFAANGTGTRYIQFRLNGTTFIASESSGAVTSGDAVDLSISTLYNFAANDYVEVAVYQNSGGALNVVSGANYSPEYSTQKVGN